jgi:single-strand DNA-binding protein
MPNLNEVRLMGNLTRDPEVRYTPKGTAIAQFGLAINRKWKDQAGQEMEEVTFVDITAFGRTAETIGQYVKKGQPLFVAGRLKLDQWEDKQTGQKRSKLAVIADGFQFLASKQEGEGGGSYQSQRGQRPAAHPDDGPRSQQGAAPEEPGDDDVPF